MKIPHGMLRIGYPYVNTVGMRRLTSCPISVVVGDDPHELHIMCRLEGSTNIRRLTLDDEDKGAFNLLGAITQIGGSFKVKADFLWPSGMVKDSTGHLWIVDEGTHKISKMTIEGEVVNQWGVNGTKAGELNRPSGIAIDNEGNIIVSDTMNHRIQKFTEDGAYQHGFGSQGEDPGKLNMPWGIDVDDAGNIYVADWRNDRIQKFDSEGNQIMVVGSGTGDVDGKFNRPSAVKVDKDGDIYVTDWANHRIQLFGADGHFVEKFIGDATLSEQARGYMITNMVAMRLREMTPIEPQKRFRWPVSVTVHDDYMYVPDFGSCRIQIYKKNVVRFSKGEIADRPRSNSLYTQF
ncbi:NHL repeat-containing protein [Dehalococcoidia bacterium]|nr:NHL repeat-containing protein [Dehalococcoidia bacterium]